jgi:hypothetical protein
VDQSSSGHSHNTYCCQAQWDPPVVAPLKEQLEKWRRELEDSSNPLGNISQWFSWLMPILMPMFLALLFLSFLPCIIKTVQRFLLDRMSAIANQKFNQLYLQGYQSLQNRGLLLFRECFSFLFPYSSSFSFNKVLLLLCNCVSVQFSIQVS